MGHSVKLFRSAGRIFAVLIAVLAAQEAMPAELEPRTVPPQTIVVEAIVTRSYDMV